MILAQSFQKLYFKKIIQISKRYPIYKSNKNLTSFVKTAVNYLIFDSCII